MSYRARPGARVDATLEDDRIGRIVTAASLPEAAAAAGLNPDSLHQWLRIGGRLEKAVALAQTRIKRVRRRWFRIYPKLSHTQVIEMIVECRDPWVITYYNKRKVRKQRYT